MMDRARVLLVAAPDAPIRILEDRLQDPDLLIVPCATAKSALDQLSLGMPDAIVIDATVPGAQVFRLYGRLRGSAAGVGVPIIFTNHTGAEHGSEATTVPDYYLGPEVGIGDVEQLLFTFLPESLVEIEEPDLPDPIPPRRPARQLPSLGTMLGAVQSRDLALPLVYGLVIAAAELLAGTVNVLAGLALHAGAVVGSFLQSTSRTAGPERAFFSTFWLVPLMRIYILSQPYVGLSTIWWWAITAVPMLVAAVVAARLARLGPRDLGLTLGPRDALVALLMLPIGLALGLVTYLVVDPDPIVRTASLGYPWLPALVMVTNPAVVQELVFRSVLLRSVTTAIGPLPAVGYVALLFGIASASLAGAGLTLAGFALMTLVGLILSAATQRLGSIVPASAAHAGLVLSLFMIAPALIPTSRSLATAPPKPAGAPLTASPSPPVRPASPVVIVPQPVQPAAGSPAAKAPGGQPPAGQAPTAQQTVVVLTTPAPAPPTAAAPGQPPTTPVSAGASPPPGGQPPGTQLGQAFTVSGTGGAGARLRSQPSTSGPTLTIVTDSTPLVVIGPDRVADGVTWRQVRTPSGVEGWVSSQFLTSGREVAPAPPRP